MGLAHCQAAVHPALAPGLTDAMVRLPPIGKQLFVPSRRMCADTAQYIAQTGERIAPQPSICRRRAEQDRGRSTTAVAAAE
jgi:hypothetical protein